MDCLGENTKVRNSYLFTTERICNWRNLNASERPVKV